MKKLIPFVLFLLIVLSLNVQSLAEGVNSGDFGSVHWSMTETTLTITGTGDIVKPEDGWPWYESDYNFRDVKNVVVGEGITSLPDEIFYHFESMTSVSLPSTLKSIGQEAFRGSGLTKIVIPEGVTDISGLAFYLCEDLTDVSVPSTLVNVGGRIFANCGLTNITIADGTTTLGEMPFYGCNKLTRIRLPGSLKSIDRDFFNDCKNIESVTFGEGFVSIGDDTFRWQHALSEVSLPSTLKTIGSGAFSYTAITEIKLPNGISEIGSGAFSECKSLVSASIPASVTQEGLGENIFRDCTSLKSINVEANITYLKGAINGCTALETVSLPNTLTSLSASDFEKMTNLRRVDVAEGGENYFSDDGVVYEKRDSGQSIVCYPAMREGDTYELLEGTTSFGCSFKDHPYLKKLILPKSMTKLNDYGTYPTGFSANTITELVLPDTMTYIYSLKGFSALESLDVPSSITSFTTSALKDCESLKSITFSDKLTTISASDGVELPALKTVTFASRPPQISDPSALFPGGKSVTVRYPSYLEILWTGTAWDDAYTLEPYIVTGIIDEGDWGGDETSGTVSGKLHWTVDASGVLTISGTGTMKDGARYSNIVPWYKWHDIITNVVVKDGVISIGQYAFYGLNEARKIELPEGLTLINSFAFEGCTSLESINLPASLTSVRSYAEESPAAVYSVDEMTYAHMYALEMGLNFELTGRRAEVTVIRIEPAGGERSESQVEAEIRAAIAPNRRVILADGIYMLQSTLYMRGVYDFSLEAENPGMAELVLRANNAPVISASNSLDYPNSLPCRFINVDGLIMGHVAARSTAGCDGEAYVFEAFGVHDLTVTRCDLWGCGVIGFAFSSCDGVKVSDTVVRDCMKNAVLSTSTEATFTRCVFSGNSYYSYNGSEAGQASDQTCFRLYNYLTTHKPSFVVEDSQIFNNYSYALINESGPYTEGEIFKNCSFFDNVWQEKTPQNYGVCLGGLTWQVIQGSYGAQTLVIGQPIDLTVAAIPGGSGTLPNYSTWSTPWKKLLSRISAVNLPSNASVTLSRIPASVTVTYSDVSAGTYKAAIAVYDQEGRMTGFSIQAVTIGEDRTVSFDTHASGKKGTCAVFLLDNSDYAPETEAMHIDATGSAS
ncbi:MAG: leucine-rich repeat protein [Clostridia bacterium]|nr:leucine-rich repeat protein [Clostridia bacterium]